MTVEVSGPLFDEGGNALANMDCVVIAIDDLIGQDGGGRVKSGGGVKATTNASGVLTIDLKPGRHILYVNPTANDNTTLTVRRFAELTVLTGETSMTLQAALDTDVGEITASTLQLAQEAAQDAVDAKNAAEAAAATVPSPSADAFLRGSSDGTTFDNLTAAQVRTALNVEDGADVTDTANVTAAGALMDSEVTNLASVKAFDPADYATSAEGDLATTALQPGDAVDQTSATGSAELPAGTTAERDGTPSAGYLRFNSTDGAFEGYDGSEWGALGGGGAVTVEEVIEITGSEAVIDIAFNGSGNDTYQIEMCSVKPAGDNVQLRARTSTDGGSTFDSGSSDYGYGQGGMGTSNSAAYMNLSQQETGGATEDTGLSGSVWVHAPHVNAATMLTTVQVQQNYVGAVRDSIGGAFRKADQSVNAIRLFWETGNFGSGVIIVRRTKSA